MTITIQLAVASLWSINTPKVFFDLYPQFLTYVNEDDHDIISNPNHPQYWNVWNQFLEDFRVVKDGDRWFLSVEDGDVFFVSQHH